MASATTLQTEICSCLPIAVIFMFAYFFSGCDKLMQLSNRSSRAETMDQNSDGDGSESSEETSDLWMLFKTVRNYTTNLGLCLSDPFLRLPSKRFVCALSLRC